MTTTSPTPSPLENLPLDVFEGICAHLAAHRSPLEKRSLAALASTSQRLRSATSPIQFQTIKLRFEEKASIPREVEGWKRLLDARGCAPHVQRLGIVRVEPRPDEWDEDYREPWPPDRREDPFDCVGHDLWPLDKDDEFWTRPEPIDFHPSGPVPNQATKVKEQEFWDPLVDFVADLHGLVDVDYQCEDQVPVALLRALNEKDGGPVRLHMYAFSLRSLYQNASPLHDVDPDEFYLATSPCLSSIRLQVPERRSRARWCDDNGRICFNEDAVAQMVAGLAPNLKSVAIQAAFTHRLVPVGDEVEWRGFFPSRGADDACEGLGKGTLEALALTSGLGAGPETIRYWARRTDFGVLRSLHLRTYAVNVPVLNALSEIAEAQGFRSLHSVSLYTWGFWDDDDDDGDDDGSGFCDIWDAELARLLGALPPLGSLDLNGPFDNEAFGAILSGHGPSLRRLRLTPLRDYDVQPRPFLLNRERTEALVRNCRNIEDLELLVPRSKGDEEEARVYRALAELPRLDRLSLLLDCSNIRAVEREPHGDSDSESNPDSDSYSIAGSGGSPNADSDSDSDAGSFYTFKPHYRDGIINLNTSSRELADDIFASLCLHRFPRLIRLYPEEIGNFGTDVRERCMLFFRDELSRGWIRERDDRGGHWGGCRVTEVKARGIGVGEREPITSEFHDALRSIWPEAEWPRGIPEMKSFPLWKPSEG